MLKSEKLYLFEQVDNHLIHVVSGSNTKCPLEDQQSQSSLSSPNKSNNLERKQIKSKKGKIIAVPQINKIYSAKHRYKFKKLLQNKFPLQIKQSSKKICKQKDSPNFIETLNQEILLA